MPQPGFSTLPQHEDDDVEGGTELQTMTKDGEAEVDIEQQAVQEEDEEGWEGWAARDGGGDCDSSTRCGGGRGTNFCLAYCRCCRVPLNTAPAVPLSELTFHFLSFFLSFIFFFLSHVHARRQNMYCMCTYSTYIRVQYLR